MRGLIHVITSVLLSLVAISIASPAKSATPKFLQHDLLSNTWVAMENIQPAALESIQHAAVDSTPRSSLLKSASSSPRFPTAKLSKAAISVPATYEGTSEVRAMSKAASISFPQFDSYTGISQVLKSIAEHDLARPVNSKITSRLLRSKSLSLPFSDRQLGLTGDVCTTSDDCQGDRVCSEDFADGLRCSFEGGGALICTTTSDCTTGEVCVPNAGTSGASLCLSSTFIGGIQDGLTGDNCTSTDGCQDGRICNEDFADGLRCSFEEGTARICNSTSVCASGEICVPNAGTAGASLCLSSAFVAETLSGYTGDNCTTTDDCQDERICSEELLDGFNKCSLEGGTASICNATIACPIGEVCVPNAGTSDASLCLSNAFVREIVSGRTGDKCTATGDCQGERICSEDFAGGLRCSFEGGAALICNATLACPIGEICVPIVGASGGSLCLSNTFVAETLTGLTGDNCNTTDDCQGDRVCSEDFADGFRCSLEGGGALICTTTIDCSTGEACVPNAGISGESLCFSSAFAARTQLGDSLASIGDEVNEGEGPGGGGGATGGGLTGDKCTTSDDCQGDRVCSEDFADGFRCSFEGGGALICTTTSDCTTGEVCVPNAGTSGASLCLSSAFVAESQGGGSSGSGGGEGGTGGGLTGDKCTTSDDCQGDRVCSEDFADGFRCSFEGGGALICTTISDCTTGEVCVPNAGTSGASLCLSSAFVAEG